MSIGTANKVATLVEGHPPRYELRFAYDPALVGEVKSLAFPKWDKSRKVWSVAATPYTERRLRELGFLSDDLISTSQHSLSKWKTDFWRHQTDAYWFGIQRASVGLWLDMGVGKTKIAIDLIQNWGATAVVVLCPKAVVPAWAKQLGIHCAVPYRVELLDHDSTDKKLAAAMRAMLLRPADTLQVLVTNYEAAWRGSFAEWLLDNRWCAVVCDESHKIKDPNGKASKFCAELGLRADRRIALTGTPLAHSPLDCFGQYRFLDPAIFGTSYHAFRARYAVCNRMFPSKVERWVNQDELFAKMELLGYRVKAGDVLDLPPVQHIEWPVKLSAETAAIYESLEDEMIAEFDDGTITIANALVKTLRLQQVTSGFIGYETADGQKATREIGTEKAEALAALVDSLPPVEPLVVFCRFRHDLDSVAAAADSAGRFYHELSGRKNDLATWQAATADGGILGVQVQSGGAGIDLTRASHAAYYSIGHSLADYDQSVARLHRPGQTRPTKFYHLAANSTIDEAVYKAIGERREVVDAILGRFKR